MNLDNINYLFIGGGPRSGTTLLMGLLDNHPNCLVFPFEHSTIERYFWNKKNPSFFYQDFILKRTSGQQSILGNKRLFDEYLNRMKKEYGNNYRFDLDVDFEVFRDCYLSEIKKNDITLETVLRTLMLSLITANIYASNKIHNVKYFCFKQPFYTDVFAQDIRYEIKRSKILSIYRDPVSRYTSAKIRRIKQNVGIGNKLSHINYLNYVLGHSAIDMTMDYLKHYNNKNLGKNNYLNVEFDSLINNSEVVIRNIVDFMGTTIKFNSSKPIAPTRLGKPTHAGSSINKGTNLNKNVLDRVSAYSKITTRNERTIHHYYLYKANLTKRNINWFSYLIAIFFPLRFTTWKGYIFQLIGIFKFSTRKQLSIVPLSIIKKTKKNDIFISGAT